MGGGERGGVETQGSHLAAEAYGVDGASVRVCEGSDVCARVQVVADGGAVLRACERQGELTLRRHAAHRGRVPQQPQGGHWRSAGPHGGTSVGEAGKDVSPTCADGDAGDMRGG